MAHYPRHLGKHNAPTQNSSWNFADIMPSWLAQSMGVQQGNSERPVEKVATPNVGGRVMVEGSNGVPTVWKDPTPRVEYNDMAGNPVSIKETAIPSFEVTPSYSGGQNVVSVPPVVSPLGENYKNYDAYEAPRDEHPGWHKRPGQNFWTVDDDSPYWDTHVKGTGSAFEGSDLKGEPTPEFDSKFWSSLF